MSSCLTACSLVGLCGRVWACVSHSARVEVGGKPGDSSFLPPCGPGAQTQVFRRVGEYLLKHLTGLLSEKQGCYKNLGKGVLTSDWNNLNQKHA